MSDIPERPVAKTLLAFAIIYFVWGSTFLAIRVGVHQVPPFLFAAMRFFTAGTVLLAWTLLRREAMPTARQWGLAFGIASLSFMLNYGLLFWAEQRTPSGVASVMMATIPLFTALAEITLLRTQRLTPRLVLALLIGLAGVAVLMSPSLALGGAPVDAFRASALIVAAISWSLGSVLTRKCNAALPASKIVSSGAQMLAGGTLLAVVSAGLGEFRLFHPAAVSRDAWIALVYLVVAGSILGFTAYVWLIEHVSPTKVGTYAYINPLVAVALGFFSGEAIGLRTVAGILCVLISVVVIGLGRSAKQVPAASHGGLRGECEG